MTLPGIAGPEQRAMVKRGRDPTLWLLAKHPVRYQRAEYKARDIRLQSFDRMVKKGERHG